MGIPAFLVHLVVLYDLKISKTTDSLEAMLKKFSEYAKDIAVGPASQSSLIRMIMLHLLEEEGMLHYFQQILDSTGPQILLHEASDETPHLLSRVVALRDEEYVLSIYDQLSSLQDIEQNAQSAYVLPFKNAFLTRKYKVIEYLYAKGTEYSMQVDEAVCGSTHPLCLATYFFPEDVEGSLKFVKAYLNATRNQDDRGIPRSCHSGDPECVFFETVLERIVKSGRCDIMELVIDQGANVNALSREGRALLDIAEGDMQKLLENKGAKPGDPKDYLLHMSIMGVKHQDPDRSGYISKLMKNDPHYIRSINTETDIVHSHWSVNLLSEVTAFCDIEAMQILLPAAISKLNSHQTIVALKRAIEYCIKDIYVDCGKIAALLRLLDKNGIRFLYEGAQGKVFVLQAVEDLLFYNRYANLNEDETVTDISYLLCKLFSLHPVKIYHKALVNISRPDWGETVPSMELLKELFILRGWKPRRIKRYKEQSL